MREGETLTGGEGPVGQAKENGKSKSLKTTKKLFSREYFLEIRTSLTAHSFLHSRKGRKHRLIVPVMRRIGGC